MLLIRALDKRWTGALTIEPPSGVTHRLQLERGLVCRVLVPDGYARLGHIVVHAGVISEDELGDVLDNDGLLGDALIRANLIDAKTLQRALLLQLLKRLTRIFSFPESTGWEYSPYDNPFEGMPDGVRIDTLRALWAGLSVHGEMGSYQDKALERIGASPLRLRRGVNMRRFGFTGDAMQLVERLQGRATTVRKLIKAQVTPAEVCERIVYLLAITRHLDFTPVGEDMEATVNPAAANDDMPSSEGESISAPVDDNAPAQRVARIKLRRVAVRRAAAAAPDQPGTGRRRSYLTEREPDSRADRMLKSQPKSGASPEPSLEAEVRSLLERLDRLSPLDIMGLKHTDMVLQSERQILDLLWRRYEEMSKRFHPDRCPPNRAEMRTGMVKVYSAITKAFEVLADPERRAKALHVAVAEQSSEPLSSGSRPRQEMADVTKPSLRAEVTKPSLRAEVPRRPAEAAMPAVRNETTLASAMAPPPSSGRAPRSDVPTSSRAPRSEAPLSSGRNPRSEVPPSQLHERALMALAEQRLHEALRYCGRASAAAPDNPDYRASSVWIRVAIGEEHAETLLEELDLLLQTHPEHVSGRYYRGVLRRRLHYHAAAQRDFERVLALEPKHEGASAQLSALKKSQQS